MARILVIDDEELARYTIREILDSAGHEVVEADNGVKGVELQDAQPFDLIVTDVLMPEKEGIETILDVLQDHPRQKIIAISGGGRDRYLGYLETARRLGASRTLAKPFSKSELLESVDYCLTRPA